jgi:aminoglycoside 3-N-acetyltransferase
MISFREIVTGLRQLKIGRQEPVIAHASLSAFGEVRGGAEILLGALMDTADTLIMPTFTYKTLLTPGSGPEDNAIVYGADSDNNRMAEFYKYDMPADPLMGDTAEALRRHPEAVRSCHPILSFSGIHAGPILDAQTLTDPLAPFGVLDEMDGWVLLMGVDHSVNTAIHYAEKLAGRKQFVRWALTREGVRECPGFPGCSCGFEQASAVLDKITRKQTIGNAQVRAIRIQPLLELMVRVFRSEPLACLCSSIDCDRCNAIRRQVDSGGE